MKYLIAFFIPLSSWAGMKAVSSSLHGERMVVEFQTLNSGKSVLVVEELLTDGKREQRQAIDLDLLKGEKLSLYAQYRCVNEKDNSFVYGVVSERRAKKTGVFPPERAWTIDEKAIRLIPVKDPQNTVKCQWAPESN